MSTRCQIQIEGSDVLIYKHSDGYPEGVLPTLKPFVAQFFRSRGWDPAYFTARCLQALANASDKDRADYAAEQEKKDPGSAARYGYDKPDCLGFGVDTGIHGDIEYFYYVDRTGTISVCVPTEEYRAAMEVSIQPSELATTMRTVKTIRLPKGGR